MRKLLLLLIVALTATGLALTYGAGARPLAGWAKAMSLAHIWGGFFFLVLFPLYAWDHVSHNRRWLRVPALVTFSGAMEVGSGALLILTGVVVLMYGDQVWEALRQAHHWLTYLLVPAIGLHFLARKG